jgi:hypothetical protein
MLTQTRSSFNVVVQVVQLPTAFEGGIITVSHKVSRHSISRESQALSAVVV